MSLRNKTLVIIGAILAGLIVILLIASQTLLLRSFEQLEEQHAREDVQRFLNALADQLGQLSATTADYATWDDTYAFIEDVNEAYIEANLGEDTFNNLSLNLMVFVNAAGEIVFSKLFDLESGSEMEIPGDLRDQLNAENPLFKLPTKDSTITGIVVTADGPMLVASRPILDSLKEQEPRGTLVFGQFLNESLIGTLAESLRLSIVVQRYGDTQVPDDIATASQSLSEQSPVVVRPLSSDQIAGYGLIDDLYGTPALVGRIQESRDIFLQGQTTISLFVSLLVAAGLVFAGATVLLLERTVLSRLTRLSRDVGAISGSSNLSGRVQDIGSDELAALAGDINQMLEALEQSQKTLRESDERLRTVVRNAPVMLLAVDKSGNITLTEGRDLSNLELDRTGTVGQSVYRSTTQIADQIKKALAGEEVSSIIEINEFTFDAHFAPLKDATGDIVGAICVATDITERMMAEEALGVTQQRLDQEKRLLERARVLFRSTLDQLTDTVHRGGTQTELTEYLDFVRSEFDRLS